DIVERRDQDEGDERQRQVAEQFVAPPPPAAHAGVIHGKAADVRRRGPRSDLQRPRHQSRPRRSRSSRICTRVNAKITQISTSETADAKQTLLLEAKT